MYLPALPWKRRARGASATDVVRRPPVRPAPVRMSRYTEPLPHRDRATIALRPHRNSTMTQTLSKQEGRGAPAGAARRPENRVEKEFQECLPA
eukprot:gene9095-biopygen2140